MVDNVSNSDTVNDLAVEYLTLVKQLGFLSIKDFQKRALSGENKSSPCSGMIKFQGGNWTQQVIMLYRFRRELDYFLKENTETDLDRHRDTLFVHSCGLRKREKI